MAGGSDGGAAFIWQRLRGWAAAAQPAAAAAAAKASAGGGGGGGGLGWSSADGEEQRSKEQVLWALLCLMDAGKKRKPIIAVGPPGREAAPMQWYHLR
jgi:hypothetical protein